MSLPEFACNVFYFFKKCELFRISYPSILNTRNNINNEFENCFCRKKKYESNIFLVQIFPEANPNEESDSYPEDFLYRRERLPSIVVMPTEHSELGSGELHGPPRCQVSNNVKDEEDSSADHTEASVDREQQEDMELDKG